MLRRALVINLSVKRAALSASDRAVLRKFEDLDLDRGVNDDDEDDDDDEVEDSLSEGSSSGGAEATALAVDEKEATAGAAEGAACVSVGATEEVGTVSNETDLCCEALSPK